jgi:ATP-dependent Clp protease ATP-binding subunit ClpB
MVGWTQRVITGCFMVSRNSLARQNVIQLDPGLRNAQVVEFENRLGEKVVGQERAVGKIAEIYQVYLANLSNPYKPLGNLLFLGPTGSGKTHIVESAAQILFGTSQAVLKIDCAEFQHTHEIAKLIGSPPGYLGHRETPPALSQEILDRYRSQVNDFSLVLFDEIEKASEALWKLLLGILDKATLTLGDNRKVDFSKSVIFMTSNLGAKEASQLIENSIGFAPVANRYGENGDLDQKIYRTALEAARKKFAPEFMNRIDSVVVFRTLKAIDYQKILDLELSSIQERVFQSTADKFFFRCTKDAKQFLLSEGIHPTFGARNLKRVLERKIVVPIANLLATSQLATGDFLTVDYDASRGKLIFFKEEKVTNRKGKVEELSEPKLNQVAMRAHQEKDNAVAA